MSDEMKSLPIKKEKKVHNHRAYMKEYMKNSDYYKCDCGGLFKQYSLHIHKTGKKHINYLVSNPNPSYHKLELNKIN